jgi:putative ABC transport system permease protein
VWTDPDSWTDIAPLINGGRVAAWFPISAPQVSLAHLDELQNALTTSLARSVPIEDGTQADHVLQLGSALPQMLNLFDNTVASTRTVLTVATIAALGLGVLVLLATMTLALGARRPVRDLLRTRGASARQLAGSTAADVAVWAVPAAVLGAGAAILVVPTIDGVPVMGPREVVAVAWWAVLPVVLAAGAVLVELLPPRLAAILQQSRWVGEALLVLFAVAAVIVTVGGGPDAATAVAGLAVGLAASVLMLRVLPVVLRWVTGAVRRGGAAVFIGLRDAGGAGWLVVASVTATATGVLALALGMSAARAQQKNVTPGPVLLAPGALTVVAAAVALCIVFAATAFAVSVVASRSPRRARAVDLRRLGYSGGQRAGVSLWGTGPLLVVSVAVGALVGAWSATPVLGAVAAASGQAVAIVVSPVAVLAVAAGILVLIVIIEAVALASDARATASTRRRGS